ncbi:hypothetical protein FB45DRAFT_906329, partial [Roridomyces roridus]
MVQGLSLALASQHSPPIASLALHSCPMPTQPPTMLEHRRPKPSSPRSRLSPYPSPLLSYPSESSSPHCLPTSTARLPLPSPTNKSSRSSARSWKCVLSGLGTRRELNGTATNAHDTPVAPLMEATTFLRDLETTLTLTPTPTSLHPNVGSTLSRPSTHGYDSELRTVLSLSVPPSPRLCESSTPSAARRLPATPSLHPSLPPKPLGPSVLVQNGPVRGCTPSRRFSPYALTCTTNTERGVESSSSPNSLPSTNPIIAESSTLRRPLAFSPVDAPTSLLTNTSLAVGAIGTRSAPNRRRGSGESLVPAILGSAPNGDSSAMIDLRPSSTRSEQTCTSANFGRVDLFAILPTISTLYLRVPRNMPAHQIKCRDWEQNGRASGDGEIFSASWRGSL